MEQQLHAPAIGELPTSAQLNRATLIAAGVAAAILATVVLPAEYGIDPTGAGRVLGLTPMGEVKREAARAEIAATGGATAAATASAAATAPAADEVLTLDDTPAPAAAPTAAGQTAEVTLTLQPGEGREVKATMQPGQQIDYRWSATGGRVNFELHGEPPGATGSNYTSYEKGKASAGETGTFRAPFAGTHGWFWRNRGTTPVTITVGATGGFSKFALMPK